MVNSAPIFLAMLALSRAVGAAPTEPTAAAIGFSFEQWVADMIANPDGVHLSADQAVEAFHNNTQEFAEHSSRGLEKRKAKCYEIPDTSAYIPDAVRCIQALAQKGGAPCQKYEMCRIGKALITGDGKLTSSCNNVARGAGFVLDQCTRKNSNYVQGAEYAYGNGNLLIRVRKP